MAMVSRTDMRFQRVVRELDRHPVGAWQVFGLLGEPQE
jgi:hypothetical protein